MIILRTAVSRVHLLRGATDVWQCVGDGGFSDLLELEEQIIAARAQVTGPRRGTVLYLCEGSLEDEEALLDEGKILVAGVFEHIVAVVGPRANASSTEVARVFRIRLRPVASDRRPRSVRVWFSAAERRGRLRLVASPTARDGALLIPQRVRIYSALLDPGQHVAFQLGANRCAWLHMVDGSADVLGTTVETSDSAEITGVRVVGITAREESEVLLFDLAVPLPEIDMIPPPDGPNGSPTYRRSETVVERHDLHPIERSQ